MYLDIKTKSNYSNSNEDFIKCTAHLTDYLFNPNRIVFNYFVSTPDNFKHKRHKILDPRIESEPEFMPNAKVVQDPEILGNGVFEEIYKASIISQDYSVLIITGASGSGKTSLIKYFKTQLDKCDNDESCIRYNICKRKSKKYLIHDFLNNSDSNIIEQFEFQLNGKLNEIVKECYDETSITKDFLNYCKSTDDPDLFQLSLILDPVNINWTIHKVLTKIKKSGESNINQNAILMSILKYYRKLYPEQHKGCYTIIFDNIDKFDDEVQTELIKKIITLHNNIECKIVITSRLTTFYKLNDYFCNLFNVLENAGPRPIDILYSRIKYYLDNKDTLQDIIDLRNRVNSIGITANKNKFDYLVCYDNILYTLLTYLSPIVNNLGEQNSESQKINSGKLLVQNTISAYSGLSVRRCIELSRRFIESSTFYYYDEPTPNQLVSSLSYTCSRGFKYNDKYIINIYGKSNDFRRNSWILYKILNILRISQIYRKDLTISQLYDLIKLYDDVDEEDFIYSVNMLIDSHKRLAYVSGTSILRSIEKDINKKTQKIHITNCGKEYLSFLATDLSYVQNCFAAIDWKTIGFYTNIDEINAMFSNLNEYHNKQFSYLHSNEINWLFSSLKEHANLINIKNPTKVFNINNISERMQFIRIGLEVLLYHDVFETYNFLKRKNQQIFINNIVSILEYSEEINSFPTLRLTKEINESFIRILKSYLRNGSNLYACLTEVKQWQSFLLKVDLWHKLLFNTRTTHSEKLNIEVDDLIANIERENYN